jgi:acyl-CoA reductase-like NAD-dependent aldehyde dehydrogenase
MIWGLEIDGATVAAGRTAPVVDPATGQAFAAAPDASLLETDAAVAAANRAWPGWHVLTHDQRVLIIKRFLKAVEARSGDLATLLTHEQGKPLARSTGEIAGALMFARAFCELKLSDKILRETDTSRIVERLKPLGVVACITAWNFPVMLAMWKIIPALLTGNCVVLKPSPLTPLSSLLLGKIGQGLFPAGVFNVIVGGFECGSRLTSHPDVSKVSFTGSVATGKAIMANAASSLKRLTLERGGNDAAIVREDAPIQATAHGLFWGKFHNCGQLCAAAKRIYIHENIYDAFVAAFVEIAQGVQIGVGTDPTSDIGPLQNQAQFNQIIDMVDDARARGGQILFQGRAPDQGFFHPIVIFGSLPHEAKMLREEAFGPIVALQKVQSDEEAILRANDTGFGLGASVWSTDVEGATAIAERLEAGTSWVNQHPAIDPLTPFGGIKESGLGVEFGEDGLREFTRRHIVNIKTNLQ